MNKPNNAEFLRNIRIILARPTHPGNMGSAARAMKTMGLTQLYLVQPKQLPDANAVALASGASDVLANAAILNTLEEALTGVTVACALTSRRRELAATLSLPRDIAPELVARAQHGEQLALVFGNETSGLSIDEVAQCNRLVTIAGNPSYSSLNLAMAVQVICYELFSLCVSGVNLPRVGDERYATQPAVEGLCRHMDETMAQVGFYQGRNHVRLIRRVRALLQRAALRQEEVDILRGFLKEVQRKTGH